jgi:2-methylcitrate dehydratase PrpD
VTAGAAYLDRLARHAAAIRSETMSAGALEATRLVVLDTLGAILAGSAEPENARLAALAGRRAAGGGAATLLGHTGRADAAWAALVNATAGVALEVDEGNRWGGGHPAIHTLPGALALAEARQADGRSLLEAVAAGYEVGSRIGGATTPLPNVHSHGTWGTISTAVAAARLGGRSAAVIRDVINLAASMSPANSWTPALAGATIRNLYPGRSAWQGLLALDLHDCGFTGLVDGPADVYGGILAERFEPEAAVAGLDGPLRIERNYVKLHACCRFNHFALDAVLDLRERHGLGPAQVAGVEVTTIPFALRMADPAPPTPLAARFSVPWAVAAALVHGHAGPAVFAAPALGDGRVRELARRVTVAADPAMAPRRSDYPTARVRLRLADGRVLEAETTVPRGDAEQPVERRVVVDKFLALAGPVLGPRRAEAVVACVEELERLEEVGDLAGLLVPAA